jgi:tetraacyldisaccharide 4'-kinase
LIAEGHHPAILTRGYKGGRQVDTHGVPLSDEVALLRGWLDGKVQLGVGKNRYQSGKALAQHGARWFVLDDGFQHLKLARDVDIVLLDSSDPFGGGRVLPAGRLREPRAALQRADIVVITRSDHAPAVETLIRRFTTAPIFYAWTDLARVLRAPAMDVEMPPGCMALKFFAFCGVGNPQAFFDDLHRWKFLLAGQQSFPDHHRYSTVDTAQLELAAINAGADALICTEKDLFNLRDAFPLTLPVYVCRIRLVLPDADGFWRTVLTMIERRQDVSA